MKSSEVHKNLRRYRRRRQRHTLDHFKDRLKDGPLANMPIVYRNTPGKKISDALVDLVLPYKDDAMTDEAYQTLLSLGILAWNLTLLAERERESMLADCIASCPQEERGMARNLIGELMARKQALFPNVKRYIVSFELSNIGDQYHINVVSTKLAREQA